MSTLKVALQAVFAGHQVRRNGWNKKNWWLDIVPPSTSTSYADIVGRFSDKGWEPWSVVTFTDMFASDYELADGNELPDLGEAEEGTLAAVIDELSAGGAIRRDFWAEKQKVQAINGQFKMTLPDGKTLVDFTFGNAELVADDWDTAS